MAEFPDRFFNTGFIIDPSGAVVHLHRKNVVFTIEHTTTPHDVWDQWVAMFGDGLDAFFRVARTPIGNIGCLICMEGNYPELARGLMMNGAEIVYRPSSIENKISTGVWQIQNQARALDNNCYVVAPNTGYHTVDAAGNPRLRDRRPSDDRRLSRPDRARNPHPGRRLRRRADQYRGAAPAPRERAPEQLGAAHEDRALPAGVREDGLAEEPGGAPAAAAPRGDRRNLFPDDPTPAGGGRPDAAGLRRRPDGYRRRTGRPIAQGSHSRQVAAMETGGRADPRAPKLRVVGADDAVEEAAEPEVVPDQAAE